MTLPDVAVAPLTGPQIISAIEVARAGGSKLDADRVGGQPASAFVAASALETERLSWQSDADDLDNRLDGAEDAVASLMQGSAFVCPGFVYQGVCVVQYDNRALHTWNNAVNACSANGAELCTTSQYAVLRSGGAWSKDWFELFYDERPVWSSSFSDNDAYGTNVWTKSWALRSADDPDIQYQYAYACCSNRTPEPHRSRAELYYPAGATVGGVLVTHLHRVADTTFPTAAHYCAALGSDLCSKSEYVTLHDNTAFGGATPTVGLWTYEQSDNDGDLFDLLLGAVVPDSPAWESHLAYACCGSQRPLDGTCPGSQYGGVCALELHNTADTTFPAAARACARLGADICSKAEMQVLRNHSVFTAASWTNDGADNDSVRVGGLLGTQPDNPIPFGASPTTLGYACCM